MSHSSNNNLELPATGTDSAYGQATLEEIIQSANQKLETASLESTNRAFNLGCSVGFLPALIFVGIVYLVSNGGWVGAIIAAIIALLALGGFAGTVANIARSNAVKRVFAEEILPELENLQQARNIGMADLEQVAAACLPSGAILLHKLADAGKVSEQIIYTSQESE